MTATTPLHKQYLEIKERYRDSDMPHEETCAEPKAAAACVS